jgi:HAD superfamily hydrolase (TIGR01509 family)
VRAVLFDLDGVLVDSYEAWYQAVNAAARHFRKPEIDRERFKASWGQGTDADLETFFPGCRLEEVERFYEDHLLDHAQEIRVDAEAHDALAQLRDAEILRGVITNTPTFLARDVLAWVGLIGLVDVTVGAGDGVLSKPAPDMILYASQVLQVQPAEAVVVGDSVFDERAAKAAKVRFLGFRTASPPSVQRLSDVVRLVGARART